MAIEQPSATDALNSPSHSTQHKIIAADSAAPVQSITASTTRVALKAPADNTTAIQLQKNDGTNVLNVDTTNGRVGIGTGVPVSLLNLGIGGGYTVAGNGITWGDGDTGIYESSDDVLRFRAAGYDVAQADVSGFGSDNSSSWLLRDQTVSATVPVIIPNRGDINTGIGHAGADVMSFIAGGTNVMNITAGNIGISTTSPTNILSLGGNVVRTFWMERHTTANTAGNTLTITAGGATSAATDKVGGALILQGGLSTGSAESGVTIQGCVAGASGTADRTQTTAIQVLGNKIGFYAATPVVQQAYTAVSDPPTQAEVTAIRDALVNLGLMASS